jgi:hypothetical protein
VRVFDDCVYAVSVKSRYSGSWLQL